MRALCLLKQLAYEITGSLTQTFAFKKLSVAKDCRQRIVQFVGYPGDELPHSRHFFTLEQLLLGTTQVFIGSACLLVELGLLDGGRKLTANRHQKVFVVAGVRAVLVAADSHNSNRIVFAP